MFFAAVNEQPAMAYFAGLLFAWLSVSSMMKTVLADKPNCYGQIPKVERYGPYFSPEVYRFCAYQDHCRHDPATGNSGPVYFYFVETKQQDNDRIILKNDFGKDCWVSVDTNNNLGGSGSFYVAPGAQNQCQIVLQAGQYCDFTVITTCAKRLHGLEEEETLAKIDYYDQHYSVNSTELALKSRKGSTNCD